MTNRDIATRADLIPHADTRDPVNAPDSSGSPTGMFAGETDRTVRQEAETREVLEDAQPDESGSWKRSGAAPSAFR